MSEMTDTHTVEARRKDMDTTNSTALRDALWLAGRDTRASWMSYAVMVLIAAFFGLLGTVQFSDALSGDSGAFERGLLDFYLLCIVPALGTNLILNRDYYAASRMDAFDQRLSFLRSLPVSGRAAISGRAISAMLAIVFAAPSFFLVPYLLSPSLREAIGVGSYLCFFCFWVGYALITAGVMYIYGAFAFRGSYLSMPLYAIGFLGLNILIPVVFRLAFDDSLTLTVLRLAGTHGSLVVAASLLVGAVVMVICTRMAETSLYRRDVG